MRVQAEPEVDGVGDTARDVFGRPEFQRQVPLAQRVSDWIAEQIQKLLDLLDVGDAPGAGAAPGGLAQLLAYVVIFLLVIGLVWAIVLVVRRAPARRRKGEDVPAVEIEIEEVRTVGEWRSAAERFEAEGRWKEALRARYRELVGRLIDLDQLPPTPGRTTRELCEDLSSCPPAARLAFEEATAVFESAWYADVPTDSANNRRFRELSDDVLRTVKEPAPPVAVGAAS